MPCPLGDWDAVHQDVLDPLGVAAGVELVPPVGDGLSVYDDDVGVGPLPEDPSALELELPGGERCRLADGLLDSEGPRLPDGPADVPCEAAVAVLVGQVPGRVPALPLVVEGEGVHAYHHLGVAVEHELRWVVVLGFTERCSLWILPIDL